MVLYLNRAGGRLHPVLAPLMALAVINEALMTDMLNGVLVGAVVVFFVVVVLAVDVPFLRWGPVTWLGAISYPLYLLHQNIGYVVMERIVDDIGPWPARAAALTVSLALAWGVHEVVEKRLSRNLSNRIKARRAHADSSASAPSVAAVAPPE